jgi:hypothetical protein
MTSATIYARVPVETKKAAETYASAKGLSMTAAMQELLQLGLEANENKAPMDAMRSHIADLEQRLREQELAAREQALQRVRAEREMKSVRQAAEVWAQRADLSVGSCPHCHGSISGRDLLVSGRCGTCQGPTTALLEPKAQDLNKNELMLVLGGIALLLGILVIAGNGQ